MASADIHAFGLSVTGEASCVGGKHPDPPLDKYPLLAWSVSHPEHGAKVFTEDGKASVESIAVEAAVSPSFQVVADKFSTTLDHVAQAVDYALRAGFLSRE